MTSKTPIETDRPRPRRNFRDNFRTPIVLATFVIIGLLVLLGKVADKLPGGKRLNLWLGKGVRLVAQGAGGAIVKFAQILATRSDLASAEFLEPLTYLFDRAGVRTLKAALDGLPVARVTTLTERFEFLEDQSSLAGSVAQIYRARDRETGAIVAVKIVRTESRMHVLHDLVLMRLLVAWIGGIGPFKRYPLYEAFSHICRRIAMQYNLKLEAAAQRQAIQLLSGDEIHVPEVVLEVGRFALVMEWLDDLQPLSRIEDIKLRRALAARCLRLLYEMIFVHGFVHADFHPGNIHADGTGRLVLLDFGLMAQIGPDTRQALARLFLAITRKDAAEGTMAILDMAKAGSRADDEEALKAEIGMLFVEEQSKSASEFHMAVFVNRLFDIQSRHQVTSRTDFTLPVLALGLFERQVRDWHRSLNFRREAIPFVLQALGEKPIEQDEK